MLLMGFLLRFVIIVIIFQFFDVKPYVNMSQLLTNDFCVVFNPKEYFGVS